VTPSLRELQQAFAGAVLNDETAVLAHVRDGTFPATRYLQIYRNNTFTSLVEALAACYPVVYRLTGQDYFEFVGQGYVRQHPPRQASLHRFGAALPDYLAGLPSAVDLPYLPDVARLEWAWQEAYHAADAPALAAETLAAIDTADYANLIFGLHPSVRLHRSPYPCLRIWQVNQPGHDGDMAVSLDEPGQNLLVARRRQEIVIEPLGAEDFALLSAFQDGCRLEEAYERACRTNADFNLAAALQRWVVNATLTHIHR
jgi:hypothetical protein